MASCSLPQSSATSFALATAYPPPYPCTFMHSVPAGIVKRRFRPPPQFSIWMSRTVLSCIAISPAIELLGGDGFGGAVDPPQCSAERLGALLLAVSRGGCPHNI